MAPVFDWLKRRGGKARKRARAREHELRGELDAAVRAYLGAGLADEAARVLLLRADAERDAEKRLVLCAHAAELARGALATEARRRKALIELDLLRAAGGLVRLPSEVARVAAELEAGGDWQKAAEAYALAGDAAGELRVLERAGAIEQLEARLDERASARRSEQARDALLGRLRDLDAVGERRLALREARAWLERHGDDAVALERDRIRDRLLRGPDVDLEIDGVRRRWLLGATVTIGRAEADLVVPASAVSRQHLRLFREDGVPHVEDLETRNGTFHAGARVAGALPIGDRLELSLAAEVSCRLTALDGGAILIDVAGETWAAPLGPVLAGPWMVGEAREDDQRFVVVRTPAGAVPPTLNGYRTKGDIELAEGDELREIRDGPARLSVARRSRP
jgi:hypothetical protein